MTTRASLAYSWALDRNLPRWLGSYAHQQPTRLALRRRTSNQVTVFFFFSDSRLIGPVIGVAVFVVASVKVYFWVAVGFSWM